MVEISESWIKAVKSEDYVEKTDFSVHNGKNYL